MTQSLCKPTGQFSLNEQFRKFDGKSSNKITIPKRPAGTGLNAVVLADGISKLPWQYSIIGKGETEHVELGDLSLIIQE